MDSKTQELFDQIVSMDQDSMTDEQKGFLMARRGYMNDEQRKRYAGMIKLHEDGKLFPAPEEDESDLETLSLKKLTAIAKAEKVDVKGLKSVKEMARAIKAHRAEA